MSNIHIAITRRVKPGLEDEFNAKLHAFVRESMGSDGVAGVHILRPPQGSESREFGILRSFTNEAAAERFYASELFSQWSGDVAVFVEGEPIRRRLTGLEAFFREERQAMPPRWKMAVVTFLGVFPAVLLWSNVLPPFISWSGYLVTSIVVNATVVASLTWVVMPFLTTLFHGWLHAGKTGIHS